MSLLNVFVEKIILNSDYEDMDTLYLRNRILNLVGETGADRVTTSQDLIPLKEELIDLAVENGKCGELVEERDCLGAELMNFITPIPSKVNNQFWTTYKTKPAQAIQDFYELSQRNDYIKVEAVSKNIAFETPTKYGDLQITINLSKPEKDPKAIAAAKLVKSTGYPKGLLAMENEGYQGRIDHPARSNHRIIRLDLGSEKWGFQYSPYAYFNEHCIFLNTEQVPMAITKDTIAQLLEILDKFPGYFAGSNSDLPIVGGSILTHNHYQGGRHTFPMEVAELEYEFRFAGYEDITAGIVNWPMSVIRLNGSNKEDLIDLADKIIHVWKYYSDESVDVKAKTGDEKHHTVTPIARMKNGFYELDLVLRDNHTSPEFPDGVYHPHPDVQHIKKENIGLIEVMGLAILPPRLKDELKEVELYLLDCPNNLAPYHKEWADELKRTEENISEDNVEQIVRNSVGLRFARVLEDAGVYKRDEEGQSDFKKFIETVGIVK